MAGKRGSNIKPHIKSLIFVKSVIEQKGTPRTALAVELRELIEKMGEVPPTEETLIRKISEYRSREANPEDKPWGLHCLDDYHVPPEALPILLRAWVHAREKEMTSFSIRQAKWVTRLYAIYQDIENLTSQAIEFALMEMVSEFMESPYDYAFQMFNMYTLVTGDDVPLPRRNRILEMKESELLTRDYIKSVLRNSAGES